MDALWRVYIYHRMGGHETDIGHVIAKDDNMDWKKVCVGSVGADIVKRYDETNNPNKEDKNGRKREKISF